MILLLFFRLLIILIISIKEFDSNLTIASGCFSKSIKSSSFSSLASSLFNFPTFIKKLLSSSSPLTYFLFLFPHFVLFFELLVLYIGTFHFILCLLSFQFFILLMFIQNKFDVVY